MALLCLCPALLFPFASWCEWDVCVHALEISQGMLLVHSCLAYYPQEQSSVCTARHTGWRDPECCPKHQPGQLEGLDPSPTICTCCSQTQPPGCTRSPASHRLAPSCKVVFSYPRSGEGGTRLAVPSARPGLGVKLSYHSLGSAHLF